MAWQTSLIYLVGGLIGGALKAWASNSQDTLSRKSLADVVVSGLVGLLWPFLGPIPLPADANIVQQAGFIAFVSYAASHLVTNVVEKLGGGKLVVLAGLSLLLGGCGGLKPIDYVAMTPEQIREFAKIKDASIMCIIANTPYGKATAVYANVDKGVASNGSVTVDDQCKTSITNTIPAPAAPKP